DAPRAAAGGRRGARPVLEGLHPRDRAGVPQADDRAARRLHRADVRGARGRRALRRRSAARDPRRAAAGRDRRGQRRLVPGAAGDGSSLLYLSLGSLGSGDVELMQRLVDTLAHSRHRIVVSKGPQHDQIRLADNMSGAEFLPQTSILPQVDLVITHGGNNTVTEALYFGKPMVLLPLFWDQYDNAQRIDECGLGARLDTYGHEPEQLLGAVDRLLADRALGERLATLSASLQSAP